MFETDLTRVAQFTFSKLKIKLELNSSKVKKKLLIKFSRT